MILTIITMIMLIQVTTVMTLMATTVETKMTLLDMVGTGDMVVVEVMAAEVMAAVMVAAEVEVRARYSSQTSPAVLLREVRQMAPS